jgi:hypothetical protein
VITEWLASIAQVTIAIGGIGAGCWAVYAYTQARRLEAARWQKHIFDDFFLSGKFDRVREALEFGYADGLGRVIELTLRDGGVQLKTGDRALLLELDNFLNLIEYVLYLEQDKGQISSADRVALLGYWLDVVADPTHASLRSYVARFGYERVAELVRASE